MFDVSQKVVCVDDKFSRKLHLFDLPNGPVVLGETYVVEQDMGVISMGGWGIKLAGKPVFWKEDGEEVGWDVRSFKRLEWVQYENQRRLRLEGMGIDPDNCFPSSKHHL